MTVMPLRSPGEEEMLAQQKAHKAQERTEKMAKRFRNTRKYQSKLWSVEKQDEIRAERAAKRLLKEEQSR